MTFFTLHPAVALVYLLSVLILTMFTVNPVLSGISLICSAVFLFRESPRRKKDIWFFLILFIMITVGNMLFSHRGETPILFMNGNPITLEALLYGVELGMMLLGACLWFGCWNLILTQDKILYLFAFVSPKISLLLSTAIRFVPLIRERAQVLRRNQRSVGLYSSDAWTDKLKAETKVYSALITWSLENAIDTAASMKARGYGLKGRSHYSLYSFQKADGLFLALIIALDGVIAFGISGVTVQFYPRFFMPSIDGAVVAAFALLCLLPVIMEVKEGLKWRFYRSRI